MNRTRHFPTSTDPRQLVALPRLIIRPAGRPEAEDKAPPQLRFGLVAGPAAERIAQMTATAAVAPPQAHRPVAAPPRAMDFSTSASAIDVRPTSSEKPQDVVRKPMLFGLLRGLLTISLLGLAACTSFTQPMTDLELRAEADQCARSTLCRALIEDRPPVLSLAVNDAALCELNAQRAERILEREGVETRRYIVRLQPASGEGFRSAAAQSQLLHTFVGARVDGKWFAVDNGSLPHCDQVCRLSEALHNVELVSSNNDYHVAVAAAASATVASNL